MESGSSAHSYVQGFSFNIKNLNVEMAIVPFSFNSRLYQIVRYKDHYNIALVRFTLTLDMKSMQIYISFYQSTGSNSSQVGVGTWFPFHCASQRLETRRQEYYYRSGYGDSYFFKMGHYFLEPFSGRCEDISRDIGIRDIVDVPISSTCSRQRNFMITQTADLPMEILYPEEDKGIGVHTIFLRFGNLLYLTASYFLFGNGPGWNPANFKDGTPERAFALVLTRISTNARFGNESWGNIFARLPRSAFDTVNFLPVNTSNVLNYILALNNVPMPHYQEVPRIDNGLDAKFVTYMKLLQMVGELYLDANSKPLWDRFEATFNRALSIVMIPLTAQDHLTIGNDFTVWLVSETFSGNNTLVRLYRFV